MPRAAVADRSLVFATRAYAAFADAIAARLGAERGAIHATGFPDGERHLRIDSPCDDRELVLVGGTISDGDTLELYDLACALVAEGARRLSIVIPFFGYSTMERAGRPGEVVTAKSRARLLSSIPGAGMGTRVYLLDLHAEAIAHYFEGGTHPIHVNATTVVQAAARRLGGDRFVLACTDAGRAKWVEGLANDLGVDAAFVFKRRLDGERTEVAGINASVAGQRVVIYDDMIRTGGSLLGAAAAYRDAGATAIAAVCTHGLFPGDALAKLRASGLFAGIVATDSHPRATALADDFLTVVSVAPLLADRLRRAR